MVEKTEGLARESLYAGKRAGLEPRHATHAQGGEKVMGVTTDYDFPWSLFGGFSLILFFYAVTLGAN